MRAGPSAFISKYPVVSFCVCSVMTIEPVGARVCMRAARLVEWPMGVYSVCTSSVRIERTTTSPVLTPIRISSGGLPSFAQARRIFAHLGLYPEGSVQCAMGVILVGYGRAEQGEDSIAGGLNYVAVVVMDRVDHQAQSRIDDRARLFWIQLLHQIHRTLDVGKEGGHCLALLVGDVS